jgi:hypothetical protein
LRRIRPQYLFSCDGYCEQDIFAAAREQGVVGCEFQHGIAFPGGPEYCWSEYAIPYRERMPIPDRIFLYGEHWKDVFDPCGFWGDRLRTVGSLRMEEYRRRRNALARRLPGRTLLVTTQGIDTAALIAFLREFLELAGSSLEFRLVVKLHPSYDPNPAPYRDALGHDGRVRVVLGSEQPSTFELLSASDFHASVSSACHYDAIGLGVPTIILPLWGHEEMVPLLRAGHALFAPTPGDLVDVVGSDIPRPIDPAVSEFYFRPGAIENLKRELGE